MLFLSPVPFAPSPPQLLTSGTDRDGVTGIDRRQSEADDENGTGTIASSAAGASYGRQREQDEDEDNDDDGEQHMSFADMTRFRRSMPLERASSIHNAAAVAQLEEQLFFHKQQVLQDVCFSNGPFLMHGANGYVVKERNGVASFHTAAGTPMSMSMQATPAPIDTAGAAAAAATGTTPTNNTNNTSQMPTTMNLPTPNARELSGEAEDDDDDDVDDDEEYDTDDDGGDDVDDDDDDDDDDEDGPDHVPSGHPRFRGSRP